MEDLRENMEAVSTLSRDRLEVLEQALALSEHFFESHIDLSTWLDEMERHVSMLAMPALRPDLIAQQQDKNEVSSILLYWTLSTYSILIKSIKANFAVLTFLLLTLR